MRKFLVLFSLLTALTIPTSGQDTIQKPRAVVVPNSIYLSTVIQQSDCPLRIEKAIVAKLLDGSTRIFYDARNVGAKPIVFFQVDAAFSDNSGLTALWPYTPTSAVLLPNQAARTNMNDKSVEFVPLTAELKERLHLNGKMKAIVMFFVKKVQFQDGSTYDASPLLDALQDHLKMFETEYERAQSPSRSNPSPY